MAIADILRFPTGSSSFLLLVKGSAARKAEAELRLKFYRDQQAEETRRTLDRLFPGKGHDGWQVPVVNLVRKIVNKRAMVYKSAPVRTFEGWDQEEGEALYRLIGANALLKKANRLTKLLKTTALQVQWRADRPALSLVTPNVLDAVHEGDPEHPTRIIVTCPGRDAAGRVKDNLTTFNDWTAETFTRRDHRGFSLSIDGNPDNVNPYARLPFVALFDHAPDDQFFLPGGDDLVETQKAVNTTLGNLLKNLEAQSHGYPWISGGTTIEAFHKQGSLDVLSPTRALMLPKDGKFGFAKPDAPIEQVMAVVDQLLKEVAVANDLPANVFSIDDRSESGRAKLIENSALIEAREDDVDLWRGYELRLFDLLKLVVNTHQPNTIPEAASLSLDFGELAPVVSETDRLDGYQRRVDLGVWSPVDALMADNGDIRDRETALRLLQERQDESAVLGREPVRPITQDAT